MRHAPYRLIPLYTASVVVAHAKVDTEDYEPLMALGRWHLSGRGYAWRGAWNKQRRATDGIMMHRHLLGMKRLDGLEGDHINRDRLDNRKVNLRVTDRAGNAMNLSARRGKSAHRGVQWATDKRLWRVRPRLHGRYYHVGYFHDELEAAEAARAWWAGHGIEF